MTNTIYPQSVRRDAYSTCSSSSSLQSPEISQRRTEEIRSKSTVRSRVKAFRVSSILGFKQKIVRDDELQLPYPSSYPLDFMKFSFEEIKTATRNMLNEHVLSVDGCAREFKGWIHEHDLFATEPEKNIPIVIKLIDREEYEDREDEARYLGQLSHPNIVMLYGYCSYKEHQLFVFESMPRKLEDHLFKNAHLLLPWGLRMKVALGVAKGLAYLHRAQVIYREFSTSIIHLDRDYNAKLSDFGIPKDCLTGDKSCSAPEYIATGHQTAKSDVYSFGILLVEILFGRQANELEVESSSREEKVMVKWSRLYLIAKVLNILDPRLKGQYSPRGAQKVAKLALKCLDTQVTTRPNMDGVAAKLEQLQDWNLMEIMECEDESTAYEEVLHMQELVDIQDAQRRKSTAYEEFFSRDGMEEEWDLTL